MFVKLFFIDFYKLKIKIDKEATHQRVERGALE
jgi:hypothetical protein